MTQTETNAMQPALDGLAPRKRRKRAPVERIPAGAEPIARLVLDVKAPHLGQLFDYLVEERLSDDAQPGVRVRVRFGGRLVDGFVWERVADSNADKASLRYIERVVSPIVELDGQMRRDVTRIADYFGGTRAQIINLAVPPRVARVEREQSLMLARARRGFDGAGDGRMRTSRADAARVSDAMLERARADETAHYGADAIGRVRDAIAGTGVSHVVWDALPGQNRWPLDLAWLIVEALAAGMPAVVVTPTERHAQRVFGVLQAAGLRPFAPTDGASGAWDGDITLLAANQPPEVR